MSTERQEIGRCANPACGARFVKRPGKVRFCSGDCFRAVGRRPEPAGPKRPIPKDARPDRLALLMGPAA